MDGHVWIAIGIHILLALIYTTPWDNYLVATGVWYYNPQLVTGIVFGYVPIEEYTFFVLETLFAGLWWWFLARRQNPKVEKFVPSKKNSFWIICCPFCNLDYIYNPLLCRTSIPHLSVHYLFLGITCHRTTTPLWRGYSLASPQTRCVDHSPNGALPLRR